jgi:hypothetical protein
MDRAWYRTVYLKSEHWLSFRANTLATRRRCESCGLSRNACRLFYQCDLDLHHLTYKRCPGRELATDVQVLCRACHEISEIPKWYEFLARGAEYTFPFKGLPAFSLSCPSCGYEISFSIPYQEYRTTFFGKVIKMGRPVIGGCECEIGNAEDFIDEHIDSLLRGRR